VRLKIHSDRSLLPPGTPHAVIFYPFWGKNPEDPEDPNSGRFDDYAAKGSNFFALGSLEEADVAVLPFDWSSVQDEEQAASAREFLARANEAVRPTSVFFSSDSDDPLPFEPTTVIRTSLYRSDRRLNEFAQPAWSEDFVERYLGNQLVLRTKCAKPVVGFCGLVPRAPLAFVRRMFGRSVGSDSTIRTTALRVLDREPAVETNFLRRAQFLGGALASGTFDPTIMLRAREEYVRNMVESDYIVCARGAGNFSYRLYETLSCGRIPVFVDTDCVLPYDFLVDWRDYCVWVDEADIGRAGELVADFHERRTEKEFEDLQRSCRHLWEEYIRPEGFFSKFHLHAADRLGQPAAT
jgi:Exostosin family